MPFAELTNTKIYYQQSTPEDPNAANLLFIGGTGGDLRVKPGIMDGPLAKRFNLLAYDQRGLGQTQAGDGPYTMAQYGDDAAAIMDYVGWDKAHVYGVSFGGMVAQHLALRHPGKICKLVLACTSSGGEGKASYPLHKIHHLEGKERFQFMMGISDTRNGSDWQRENAEQVDKMWQFSVDQRKDITMTDQSIRGAYEQIEARKGHDISGQLNKITAETFICGGKYDGLALPSNLESLHQGIANSKLSFYQGGHLFMIQDPSAIKDIEEFLKSE